jgi:hypothetical protein
MSDPRVEEPLSMVPLLVLVLVLVLEVEAPDDGTTTVHDCISSRGGAPTWLVGGRSNRAESSCSSSIESVDGVLLGCDIFV